MYPRVSQRWDITTKTTGEEAVEALRSGEWFDLVILDYHLGDGLNGLSVAEFLRENSVNKDAIVVLNSGSILRTPEGEQPLFDLVWTKPLPSNEEMRFGLCMELLKSKSGGNEMRSSHRNPAAKPGASVESKA